MNEVHHPTALIALLNAGRSIDGLIVQSIDLAPIARLVRARTWAGATFLGCTADPETAAQVVLTGGAWFPAFSDVPYDAYRSGLYTQAELEARDEAIHRHVVESEPRASMLEALGQRIHDHAVDDALADLLHHHEKVVAVMGGHRLARTDPLFADVAVVARTLTRLGYLVATGGGPGAMEAANLGAWLAPASDDTLADVLTALAAAPTYDVDGSVGVARAARDGHPGGGESLAVPTWFYGHEPSNVYATHVAKYFSNSLREDGLLAIATHGVIYMPGSAGTVQELFMDATQNHYGTFALVSPMVLYGSSYWTDVLPAHRLLRSLAGQRDYASMIGLVDTPDGAVDYVVDHPPRPWTDSPPAGSP